MINNFIAGPQSIAKYLAVLGLAYYLLSVVYSADVHHGASRSRSTLAANLILLSANPTKWSNEMIIHTQTIRRQQPTNRLSVYDHFVGLTLKGLGYAFSHC